MADRVLAWVNGQNTTLIMIVMTTIAQPYERPIAWCSVFIASSSAFEKKPQKPKPITASTLLLSVAETVARVRYSFGPA